MTTSTMIRSQVPTRPRSRTGAGHGDAGNRAHEAAEDLCGAVFGSLRRRDQREKGLQYVRGLLATPGRKSIRNIAQQIGGPAAEQSLHHFIAGSTWDWQPIRTALSQYLEQSSPLTAWVAQPMAIPKGGEHSVGVGRQYDPHRGQMFRGQQAFGIWFTSADVVTPVGWRLYLPEEGTGASAEGTGFEGGERSGETYEECAVTGVLDAVRQVAVPPRPVLLDIQNIGTRSTMNRFADAKLPVLARISPAARLLVTDPALPGHGAGTLAARDVLQNVRALRTPVEWADPMYPGQRRTSLVAAVRVMMPDPSPARRRHLTLLGEWTDARSMPSQLWVTDLARPVPVTPAVLLRMTKQARRVSVTSARSVQEVGLRDFAGRSLPGWHRHVTMASVAHAARCLSETGMPVGRDLV
ncbi:transposase [Streptomyces sp. NBC_00536]|nr:transposase [Streptomyces sp. NBC_00536]WUC79909.1 transposase [Streptomyces sp. NBC_00536]